MHLIDFGPDRATAVSEYAPHPAGFAQLWLVVDGEGWVAGADGVRHRVGAGTGALIARGAVTASPPRR